MKSLLSTAGLLALLSVGAYAGPVTYGTNVGSELCIGAAGCGVLSQTISGLVTLTFSPIAPSTVTANPTTFGSFGELVISCVGGGTGCGNVALPSGLTLYIKVTQSVPSGGAGTISGTLAGTLSGLASSTQITWPIANAITIGTVQYSVANNPLSIVPPSVNGGTTTLQAVITDRTAPEPATYAMLATGLVGLGLLRRRR